MRLLYFVLTCHAIEYSLHPNLGNPLVLPILQQLLLDFAPRGRWLDEHFCMRVIPALHESVRDLQRDLVIKQITRIGLLEMSQNGRLLSTFLQLAL